MRDIPGSALIFTFYEFFKESLTKYDTKAINFLAGGLASFCTWIFTYPQDMIKTRFLYQDRAILKDITHQIFIENGVKGFYRGVNIVMLRSLLTGSISFFMMENCKNLLQRQNN